MKRIISITIVLVVSACGGAPQLGEEHPGYRQPLCFDCHGKTTEFPHGSEGLAEPDCAGCHGPNGAPPKDHAAERVSCKGCHGAVPHVPHFSDPQDCRGCHAPPPA